MGPGRFRLRPMGVGPQPQTGGRARVALGGGARGWRCGALFVVALMLDYDVI